jgi:hypothetical protein
MVDFENLTLEQREALKRIVEDWINEGFTTPPYEDAYYDIFEALDVQQGTYDTRRPLIRAPKHVTDGLNG